MNLFKKKQKPPIVDFKSIPHKTGWWTSVQDGLPEPYEKVLVIINGCKIATYTGVFCHDGEWSVGIPVWNMGKLAFTGYPVGKRSVSHWAKIPEF
jgi:hypothetical protein